MNVDETPLLPVSDFIIRQFLLAEIFDADDLKGMNLLRDEKTNLFRADKFHITLFRLKDCNTNFENLFNQYKDYEFGPVPVNYFDISTRWQYD